MLFCLQNSPSEVKDAAAFFNVLWSLIFVDPDGELYSVHPYV